MDETQSAVLDQQIEELKNLKEDDLYRKLGVQVKEAEHADPQALEQALTEGALPEPEGAEMGLGENLREFGRRWWDEMEPKLYALLCTDANADRDKLLALVPSDKGGQAAAGGGKSADSIASVLAPLLMAVLPVKLPILAASAALIAAKMIMSSGLKTTCEMWQESIETREKERAKSGAAASSDAAPAS